MSAGLDADGYYVQPGPNVQFDLDPGENPDNYYEDDETGPRPRFPVPAYAGGAQPSTEYDDVDFDAYGAAQRAWVKAAQEANRDGKRWPPCPNVDDYRVTP